MRLASSLKIFELPLLFKELIERASRRRTYILRAVMAGMIYLWVCLANLKLLFVNDPAVPFEKLGHGKLVLDSMVLAETVGLYLLLPALCCGVIAGEKESNTLPLLFVTRLRPWTIVFEKYLSCLVMAISFLLLGVPCMMITYPMGGLSFFNIVLASWTLLLTAGVVISISLLSSAWCRTVAGAVILGYVLNVLILVWPMFVVGLLDYSFWQSTVGMAILEMFPSTRQMFLFPFSLYFFSDGFRGILNIQSLLHHSLPAFSQILVCLCLTRAFLIRRSEGRGTNWLRLGFGKLDALFRRINNNRLTRGIVVTRRQFELPEDHPIAWRETSRSALTSPAHLIRLWICLFSFPAIVFLISPESWLQGRIGFFYGIYFLLTFFSLIVKGSTLISSERSRQTLDVLLSTPTAPRELLSEKMRGIWRLFFVLVSILILLNAILWWLSLDLWRGIPFARNSWLTVPLSNLILLLIELPILVWISVLVGMKSRSSGRSVIMSLGLFLAWWILPLFLLESNIFGTRDGNSWMWFLGLFIFPWSIATIGSGNSPISNPESICLWFAIMGMYYLFVLFLLRFWILRNAGRFLGRLESAPNPRMEVPA